MIYKHFLIKHHKASYYFNKTFGVLLDITNVKSNFEQKTQRKITSANALANYNAVLQPYQLDNIIFEKKKKLTHSPRFARFLVRIYTYLCLKSFIFVRLLSAFKFPLFENATDAVLFYRQIKPKQEDLCMPRSLFVACTSKRFKEKGTLFIGISLPTKSMHAWVIEDNTQPDLCDSIWINFQPVLILYHK